MAIKAAAASGSTTAAHDPPPFPGVVLEELDEDQQDLGDDDDDLFKKLDGDSDSDDSDDTSLPPPPRSPSASTSTPRAFRLSPVRTGTKARARDANKDRLSKKERQAERHRRQLIAIEAEAASVRAYYNKKENALRELSEEEKEVVKTCKRLFVIRADGKLQLRNESVVKAFQWDSPSLRDCMLPYLTHVIVHMLDNGGMWDLFRSIRGADDERLERFRLLFSQLKAKGKRMRKRNGQGVYIFSPDGKRIYVGYTRNYGKRWTGHNGASVNAKARYLVRTHSAFDKWNALALFEFDADTPVPVMMTAECVLNALTFATAPFNINVNLFDRARYASVIGQSEISAAAVKVQDLLETEVLSCVPTCRDSFWKENFGAKGDAIAKALHGITWSWFVVDLPQAFFTDRLYWPWDALPLALQDGRARWDRMDSVRQDLAKLMTNSNAVPALPPLQPTSAAPNLPSTSTLPAASSNQNKQKLLLEKMRASGALGGASGLVKDTSGSVLGKRQSSSEETGRKKSRK